MVVVRKRKIGNQTYFYLEHSQRKGKNVEKKELYLGKEVPKDLVKVKKAFLQEIAGDSHKQLAVIKKNYTREQKALPPSAKKKELETFSIKFTYDLIFLALIFSPWSSVLAANNDINIRDTTDITIG